MSSSAWADFGRKFTRPKPRSSEVIDKICWIQRYDLHQEGKYNPWDYNLSPPKITSNREKSILDSCVYCAFLFLYFLF